MDDKQRRGPRFWPVIFVAAFLVGAALWGLWMSKLIRQTRANRGERFFVPMATNRPPATNGTASPTNPPAPGAK
jgi:hypothetical protein